jgi:hypothetical protein
MFKAIDIDNERLMGPILLSRSRTTVYMDLLNHRRRRHPIYKEYVFKKFRSAVIIFVFCKRAAQTFKDWYYTPENTGYTRALNNWGAALKV